MSRTVSRRHARRVGHVEADLLQHLLDLAGRAEVDGGAVGDVAEHRGVALGADGRGVRLVARPWAGERLDERFGDGAIDRETVGGELGAEELGGRLAPSRGLGAAVRIGGSEPGLLQHRRVHRSRGPTSAALGRLGPAAGDPLRVEVAVVARRLLAIGALVDRGEEVEGADRRQRGGGQVVQASPDPARLGAPAAEQQAVHRGEVPARRQTHAVTLTNTMIEEPRCGLARPDDPARAQLVVDRRHRLRLKAGARHPGWCRDSGTAVGDG